MVAMDLSLPCEWAKKRKKKYPLHLISSILFYLLCRCIHSLGPTVVQAFFSLQQVNLLRGKWSEKAADSFLKKEVGAVKDVRQAHKLDGLLKGHFIGKFKIVRLVFLTVKIFRGKKFQGQSVGHAIAATNDTHYICEYSLVKVASNSLASEHDFDFLQRICFDRFSRKD